VAGSFIRFVADAYGPAVLMAVAAGEDFEAATGRDLEMLVVEWRAYLEQTVGPGLPPEVVRAASGRFEGPGVLGRRCPVDTARVLERADSSLALGDLSDATSCLRTALEHRPGDRGLLRRWVRVSALAGNPGEVEDASAALVSANGDGEGPAPEPDRLPVADRMAIGDALALLAHGTGLVVPREARVWIATAVRDAGTDADRRAATVRLLALDLPPEAGAAVIRVLSGLEPGPADLVLSEAASVAPDSWGVRYLLGRARVGAGAYADAVTQLEAALALGVPTGTFEAEAEKMLGKAATWAGDAPTARRHLSRALALAPYEGDRLVIEEYLARTRDILPAGGFQ
jgi:tetratricopeptide (TPR) repeat protein